MAARSSQYRRAAPALVDQRSAPRHWVVVTRASVRRHGEPASDAVLHNLSIYGCRLATTTEHMVEERLWLRFGGGMPIAATVMWVEDDVIGCRFDEAIDNNLLRTLTLAA